MPLPTTINQSKGIQPISELLSSVLPKDFGDADAEAQVQSKMANLDPKFQKVVRPSAENKNSEAQLVPEVKAPEAKSIPIIDPNEAIKADSNKTDLSSNLPDPGFGGDKLLEALEGTKVEEIPAKVIDPVKEVLEGKLPESKAEEAIPEALPVKAKDAQAAFAKMTKLLKEKEHKIKELEAKGNIDIAASATEPLRQQIADLEKQRQQMLNGNAAIALESRPEIQERYIKPLQTAEAYIRDIAKSTEGMNARALLDAANEPDRGKRVAAVRAECTDMHPNDALRVEQAVDAIHILNTDLTSLRANASDLNKKFETQQQQQLDAKRAEFRAEAVKVIDSQFENFIKGDKVISHFVEQDPKVKEQLGKVLDAVKRFDADFSWAEDHKTRSTALLQALAYPIVTKIHQNALKQSLQEIKELKAQNLKLKNAGVSTVPRGTYTPPKSDEPQSLSGIISDAFKGTQLA